MTRDQLIREMRTQAATWKAVAVLYAVLVGTMIGSAAAIL